MPTLIALGVLGMLLLFPKTLWITVPVVVPFLGVFLWRAYQGRRG